MADDVNTVHTWLQGTLLPDATQRQAAEEALEAAAAVPAHVVCLFRLCADPAVPAAPEYRQAAAVRMKNLITKRWEAPSDRARDGLAWANGEGPAPPLAEADKAVVRENLLEAMIFAPSVIRAQLGLCLRRIAGADFPERWPSLLPAVVANLQQQEEQRLSGALAALRVLCRVYEFKPEDARPPLFHIVEQTFPLTLRLIQAVLQAAPAVNTAELALLATKIFWSATQLSLPPLILQPETSAAWCAALRGLLEQPLPPDAPTTAEGAREWPPWKLKKRCAQIAHRLFSRYGPQQTFSGPLKPQYEAFAANFAAGAAAPLLQANLALVTQRDGAAPPPDRVVTMALNYVEEAVRGKATWPMLKPQVEPLLLQLIFPLLCFGPRDDELWRSDPHEFIRKEFDVIEDLYSPRTAASNVLRRLMTSRAKVCLHPFVTYCSGVLGTAAQPAADGTAQQQKDGALFALGTLHNILYKRDEYKASLEPMLQAHVLPALASPHGFLRARCCWVYGQFAHDLFAGGKSAAADSFHAAVRSIIGLVRDRELPVRVQAALAVNAIVEHECCDELIVSVLPQLTEALFELMQTVGNEDVVQTLDTLIEHHGEHMAPYAVQVVTLLATQFLEKFDEQGQGDDDDLEMTMMSLMQAISTMMDAVSSQPTIFPSLEAALLPLLERLTRVEGEDYFEDALELLSYLTYYSPAISPGLWSLYPRLHAAYLSFAKEHTNSIITPLDNYISRGTDAFLGLEGGRYVGMLLEMARAALITYSDDQGDADVFGGAQMLEVLLYNCKGRVDAALPEVLGIALQRLSAGENTNLSAQARLGVGTADTGGPMAVLLYNVLSAAIHYSPPLALEAIATTGADARAVLGAWLQHTEGALAKLRVHDLKIRILALSSLLAWPTAAAPPLVTSHRLLVVRSSVHLLLQIGIKKKELEERKAAGDADDDDDDDDDDEGASALGRIKAMVEARNGGGGGGDGGGGDEDDDEAEAYDDDDDRLMMEKLKLFQGLDDLDDDDELSDDEDFTSPLDQLDEAVEFCDAFQAACADEPVLIHRVGLMPGGAAPELAPEETTSLDGLLKAATAAKRAALEAASG